jgi:hypothetical protein
MVTALFDLACVLRKAENHVKFLSRAADTGPAIAREAVQQQLSHVDLMSEHSTMDVTHTARYWQHQLRFVLALGSPHRPAADAGRSGESSGVRNTNTTY